MGPMYTETSYILKERWYNFQLMIQKQALGLD